MLVIRRGERYWVRKTREIPVEGINQSKSRAGKWQSQGLNPAQLQRLEHWPTGNGPQGRHQDAGTTDEGLLNGSFPGTESSDC